MTVVVGKQTLNDKDQQVPLCKLTAFQSHHTSLFIMWVVNKTHGTCQLQGEPVKSHCSNCQLNDTTSCFVNSYNITLKCKVLCHSATARCSGSEQCIH